MKRLIIRSNADGFRVVAIHDDDTEESSPTMTRAAARAFADIASNGEVPTFDEAIR
jgi:hypothetical protein